MACKYLYGAAVQGIQSFIFQTNKLREIVGASELVEKICKDKFKEIVGDGYAEYNSNRQSGSILQAAGNVKYIFNTEEECSEVVRKFPKEIYDFAPGITVSQAVVKMEGENAKFDKAVNELEKRLRTQRNTPMRSATLGMMAIQRSRQTGLPVVEERQVKKQLTPIDSGTRAKLDMLKKIDDPEFELTKSLCNTSFGKEKLKNRQIAYDIEKMTKDNDWVAVIHADGNGLGQIVQAIGTDAETFKEFSEKLDSATKKAAQEAYQSIKKRFDEEEFIPIRPIVLGGDDFTVICRADLALEYVTEFINQFEENTKFVHEYKDKSITFSNLTACAGIAYVKSSYPFYYGYELAEALCSRSKKDAKANLNDGELAKSCLMFHKVQDSFTENWEETVKRELTPQQNISFEFGPYYINEKKEDSRWLVSELLDKAKELNDTDGNAVKSNLRNWMSLLHDNPAMAEQKLLRLKAMTKKEEYVKCVTKGVSRNNMTTYPVYDILSIHTINTQKTK